MISYNVTTIYNDLTRMGLVRNKRHFSCEYMNRGKTYLRDLERSDRDRSGVRIPAKTVMALRGRLHAIAQFTSGGVKTEIGLVLTKIDQGTRIADALGYR